jgi:hypothetical protein
MKYASCRYRQGTTLAGILHFHRISGRRMGGISRKNFSMFRKLCGEKALQNLVVITNMWAEVDPQVGDAREAELAGSEISFKLVLDKGARMTRHDNTIFSAENIIRPLLPRGPFFAPSASPLTIGAAQYQMVMLIGLGQGEAKLTFH